MIVPATLPVCSAREEPAKSACDVLAGIVKLTVRPPVENCTEGSFAGLAPAGVKVSVRTPVMSTGYGLDSATSRDGC